MKLNVIPLYIYIYYEPVKSIVFGKYVCVWFKNIFKYLGEKPHLCLCVCQKLCKSQLRQVMKMREPDFPSQSRLLNLAWHDFNIDTTLTQKEC